MSQNTVKIIELDKKFMSYAISLSRKNIGNCAENPTVGCVIAHNGEIISSAVTAKNGRPHAEKIAIEKVPNRELLKESVIYVTLEPCSHFGKTSPCVDEIIECQFKKVVIATKDPDERVNGSGIKKLQQAGIEVVFGILESEAREVSRGFFKAKEFKRPFVTLKLATSLDGKIATKDFDSKWITSPKSREFSHLLRSKNNAILVGGETARKDNPTLNCRLSGFENSSPKKVIISQSLNLDPQLNIFQKDSEETVILTTNNKNFPTAKTIICQEKNGKIDLNDALEKLCQSGINSLLVEGGSQVATSFLQENLVDELIWIRSSKIIGNDGIAAIGEMGFSKISEVFNGFKRVEIREIDEDLVEIFRAV
jgi:diaminohydroxyphosphoribosylaminopyrimidine deaminase/5-amino-6-(5-phosphoribosylamino)uracil reductase